MTTNDVLKVIALARADESAAATERLERIVEKERLELMAGFDVTPDYAYGVRCALDAVLRAWEEIVLPQQDTPSNSVLP
jgi:hypothetical protein